MSASTAFVVAAWLVAAAAGCSEFALRSSTGKYQMTARTLDFGIALDSRIRAITQGSYLKFPAVCQTCQPALVQAKYDIVGSVSFLDYENAFYDGLNSGGLSIGVLFDDGVAEPADRTGDRPAIPFMYIASYILANFKTVAEVQAALKPELVQLTPAWVKPELKLLFMPFHIGINDATGATAVLELRPTGADPKTTPPYVITPNPLRTLTNSPNLPLHEEYYQAYVQDPSLVPPYVADNLKAMFPEVWETDDVLSRYVNVPGDATSASRRIRLALFRNLTQEGGALPHNVSYMGYLPDTVEGWSPNYGGNEWLDTFAMAVNAMQHNVIVNGLMEGIRMNNDKAMNNGHHPGLVAGGEHTLIMQIRDHTNLAYFWWTHRAQRWQSFDLKSIKKSSLACLTPLPAVASSFFDRTTEMNGVGVRVSATGPVAPGMCWAPQCPSVLRGLGIKCQCGGERAYGSASGCGAPLSRADAETIIQGFPWADKNAQLPVVQTGTQGVLTIQVTSCGSFDAQRCCSMFAAAVRAKQTLLPASAPVACITAEGATLAPGPL